jgi:hypothetical protein
MIIHFVVKHWMGIHIQSNCGIMKINYYKIEAGDFDICYENLCLIFDKLMEIRCIFLGKKFKDFILKVQKDKLPCNKIPEFLKNNFK